MYIHHIDLHKSWLHWPFIISRHGAFSHSKQRLKGRITAEWISPVLYVFYLLSYVYDMHVYINIIYIHTCIICIAYRKREWDDLVNDDCRFLLHLDASYFCNLSHAQRMKCHRTNLGLPMNLPKVGPKEVLGSKYVEMSAERWDA